MTAAPAEGATVAIDDLAVSFPQSGQVVLEHVSLRVERGEFVSIVGPSGSGKTTLLRAVAGLIGTAAGTIAVNGKRITGPVPESAFVFQADSLLPWRSVVDNVGYGLQLRGVPRETARRRARELLGKMGLAGTEKQHPRHLSGGMRQRVNLARALAVDPALLLMDEPFAALDAQTRDVLQLELLNIWEATGKTILFVTHQLDEAVFLSNRVVVLGTSPGHIKDIIPIDGLPTPRGLDSKHTAEFAALVDRVWKLIRHDVMRERRHVNMDAEVPPTGV